MIILIFGDSIAYGCCDEEGGWVSRLRRFIDKKVIASNFEDYTVVYNLGVSRGMNTNDFLVRFDSETKSRISENKDITFIFAIGVNDSQFINKEERFVVSPEQFRTNIRKLIQKSQKFSSNILFLGLAPVDNIKVDPIPWLSVDFPHAPCQERNPAEARLSRAKADKKLLVDGVHPNTEGHKVIFEIVKEFLIHKRII